jgi:CTP:molybdopterin cytidylyltransferase MocA
MSAIGGLVLAAGEARRFGGPKQLAQLDGAPLLQHAVDAMEGADEVEPVRVLLGARADMVAGALTLHRADVLVVEGWAEGMAASLRAGVTALDAAGCDWAVVTLGDQPRVTSRVIAALAHAASRARFGTAAIRATYDGVPGHPVALGRPLFGAVAELRGDAGARALLDAPTVLVRELEVGRLADPVDVDTPADLEDLRS